MRKTSVLSLLGKKGEVDSIDDTDLVSVNDNSIDQGAEDLSACIEIGIAEARVDRCREAVQASEGVTQAGLFSCLRLCVFHLAFQFGQSLPGTLDTRFELVAVEQTICKGINQPIDCSLRIGDLFFQ